REARNAVSVRDEFITLASHELKTPLTALQLAVQTLARVYRKESPASGVIERSLAAAERQTRRFGMLIDNLLNVSRISAGGFACNFEEFDLSTLVRDAVAQLSTVSGVSPDLIAVDVPEHAVGHWDRTGLERLMTNLLANAIRYGAGRPIDVRVRL